MTKANRKNKKHHNTPRRRSFPRTAAKALAAGATIAAGTQAYAAPVRFNAGEGYFFNNSILDITTGLGGQPGDPLALSSFRSRFFQPQSQYKIIYGTPFWTQEKGGMSLYGAQPGGEILHAGNYTLPIGSGQLIGGSPADWASPSYLERWHSYGEGPGSWNENFPLFSRTYIGLRFDPGDGVHYGWVAAEWYGDDGLKIFAWAYETDPGVPIVAGVPEPGTLALLAFGAAGVAIRRRRKD